MRLKRKPVIVGFYEEFLESNIDPYSDSFNEEDAMEGGWKANEIAFLRGFRGLD